MTPRMTRLTAVAGTPATLEQLQAHVWEGLGIKKHAAGRRIVERITRRAVRQWPVPVLLQCDAAQANVVGTYYTRTITRQSRQEFGMGIILSLILGALVQEIIKLLVAWWIDNRSDMVAIVSRCSHDN
jgi:hypothetical protein